MQIVTDHGADISTEQREGLDIHYVPLTITLGGRVYRGGVDISVQEFYELLDRTGEMPSTSQPSPGDFAELYRNLARTDPDILSVHISSGLSGTVNAARMGASMVPEANVTIYDTRTLSGAQGWHVEAAARAAKAGWGIDRIVGMLQRITAATDTLYTLSTLKYLIHGGRISHLKGLVASILNIKPIIGVEKVGGTYVTRGQTRTLDRAIDAIVNMAASAYPANTVMRMQVLHGLCPEGAARLRAGLDRIFQCRWLPVSPIAPVLGAHTGPGLVGVVFAPEAQLPQF
ncbi:MAG: DegV domain-containing protein [Firmicutes bacterium ADurb.BinA052]|jgi:DegV family protein with EDD domain|nr:MAG: DegV domain-containing protein [Firmicutes bacterium ADurb.BinA052]